MRVKQQIHFHPRYFVRTVWNSPKNTSGATKKAVRKKCPQKATMHELSARDPTPEDWPSHTNWISAENRLVTEMWWMTRLSYGDSRRDRNYSPSVASLTNVYSKGFEDSLLRICSLLHKRGIAAQNREGGEEPSSMAQVWSDLTTISNDGGSLSEANFSLLGFRFLSLPFSYSFLLLMPLIRLESPRPHSDGFFTFEASKKFPRVGKCNVVCARHRWNSLELARKESSCVFWP